MNFYTFEFAGQTLHALGSGALYWPAEGVLCVSDLHLGKSERVARRSRQLLPPYETRDTLQRLDDVIAATAPRNVICLGDSFDDLEAGQSLPEDERLWLIRLMAGRRWVWIEGNHDPGPLDFGGTHLGSWQRQRLLFRHIAGSGAEAEVSGHYHPKVSLPLRGRMLTRPSFLVSRSRVIMPAFGTYTGGLRSSAPILQQLMGPDAYAIMTGPAPQPVSMPVAG